jgi:hypothetical protein
VRRIARAGQGDPGLHVGRGSMPADTTGGRRVFPLFRGRAPRRRRHRHPAQPLPQSRQSTGDDTCRGGTPTRALWRRLWWAAGGGGPATVAGTLQHLTEAGFDGFCFSLVAYKARLLLSLLAQSYDSSLLRVLGTAVVVTPWLPSQGSGRRHRCVGDQSPSQFRPEYDRGTARGDSLFCARATDGDRPPCYRAVHALAGAKTLTWPQAPRREAVAQHM